ncbi:AMP-binding protein [Flavobacterium sp. LS1R49]|uniref:AMP-binding protein n=1 Tax=Flavobacterium shii TaxID=2987687 RepID=A0A9X3C765_9FLAO|nr:AMP-binding protein [Flavobacterium shii]MCV9927838.1 AMP-binding protein [Flavobacterium shii]
MIEKQKKLTDLFEHIANIHPDRIAIKDSSTHYTYSELQNSALKLASRLKKEGVKVNDRIGLLTKKDNFTILLFWGISYAGGIPVLLDDDDEILVLKNKLKSSQPSYIIVRDSDSDKEEMLSGTQILHESELMDGLEKEESLHSYEIAEVCYMITTSGTTGMPKVIEISHDNVLHYVHNLYELLKSPDRINAAHVTNFSTDLGHTNLLLSLISGGMLYILDRNECRDPFLFNSILKREQINFIKTTPSHIEVMLPFLDFGVDYKMDFLVLGGEKLPWKLVRQIKDLKLFNTILNHYGPSETTVGALVYPITETLGTENSVPIGKPIGNGNAYLVNKKNGIGELYIEGPGVGIGYFNNDNETKEKFFFNEETNNRGYKTGDICSMLEDGNFIFLRRDDNQVKIRGHRVELDEIESTLNKNPKILYSRLNTFYENNTASIECFIKVVEDETLKKEDLLVWLKKLLPDYKIPAYIYIQDDIVYTGNGKIDFKALRKQHFTKNVKLFKDLDLNSWEDNVLYCWQEVFGIESRDRHFLDSGGDSLSAIKFVGKLQLNGFDVNLADLYDNPSFEHFIALNRSQKNPLVNNIVESSDLQFTSSQLTFLKNKSLDLNLYTQTLLFDIEGDINIKLLGKAIEESLKSHESYNLKYINVNNDFFPENNLNPTPPLVVYNLNSEKLFTDQLIQITNDLVKSISIEEGILFKSALITDTGKNLNYLFLVSHHLITDAISWNTLLEEILWRYESLYIERALPVSKEQIQNHFYKKNEIETSTQKDFCKPLGISEEIKGIPISKYNSRHSNSVVSIVVANEYSEKLRQFEVMSESHLKLQDLFLSSFVSSVFDFYDIRECSVDIEFHGRPEENGGIDLSRSVSWWSTTIPVDFDERHRSVQQLKKYMSPIASYANNINSHSSIFSNDEKLKADIRFNYLGKFPESYENTSLKLKPSHYTTAPTRSNKNNSEYKLFFTGRFIGDNLIFDIQYNTDCFNSQDIHKITNLFLSNLAPHIDLEKNKQWSDFAHLYYNNVCTVGKPMLNFPINKKIKKHDKAILLTGATGFLGSSVLRDLLLEEAEVFCLIKSENLYNAKQKLKDTLDYYFPGEMLSEKVNDNIVLGDLSKRHLGLDDYGYLTNRIDVIIHCGANVNLVKSYDDLNDTNVFGTEQIISFANEGKVKTLHYISTLAVSGYTTTGGQDFSEHHFDINQKFLSGYEKSKFQAEKIVRMAFDQGLKGKIYRVGHIGAHSVTGKFQKNAGDNRVIQVLNGIIALNQIPVSYTEKISFSYVDVISNIITSMALQKIICDLDCIHLENTAYFSIKEIASIMNHIGYPCKIVDDAVFKNAVLNFKGSEKEYECIYGYNIWVNRFLSQKRNVKYLSNESNEIFSKYGVIFPELSKDWLKKLIVGQLKSVNIEAVSIY